MSDYDFDDTDYEYYEYDDGDYKSGESRRNKADKKKKIVCDNRPKTKQLVGKIMPITPSNLDDGIYILSNGIKYYVEMNKLGEQLKKKLFHEVMVYGVERIVDEGRFILISSYL